MDKKDFRNHPPQIIENFLKENGISSKNILNFKNSFKNQKADNIRSLNGFKNKLILSELLPFHPIHLISSIKDSRNNEKFIFKTSDNHKIESVLMPDKKNISICVSVQAGCRFGCSICRTGKLGFKRDLTSHEILEQLRIIYQSRIFPARLSCVSFMGMGEPFDNLKNCMIAAEWIASNWLYQISREKITFSTSGALSFKKFLTFYKLPNLAVSLHSAIPEKRKILLPKAKINLKILKENMVNYTKKSKRPVSLEYCLIKGLNDGENDAYALIEYISGLPCKINLLNYNIIPATDEFEPASEKNINAFKNTLKNNNIQVIYRKSLGSEICAGCGQLGGGS